MHAEAYYRKNAAAHGERRPIPDVAQTGRLPARPDGPDYAIYWAQQARARRRPDAAAIDVGCAQLTLLRSLDGLFARRVGIDVTAYPEWDAQPTIETRVVNLDEGTIPYPDATFDCVTMLMVLEHVFDPFHVVRELRRIARPDADVIVQVPNVAGIRHRVALARGRLPVTSSREQFDEEAWDGQHLHQFTQGALAWLLVREGLEPVQWVVSGRLARVRSLWPSLLGSDLVVRCRPAAPRAMPHRF